MVDAEVTSLIRGQGGIPPRVSFLAHVERKDQELRRRNDVMIFARPAERPGQLRLVSRNATQSASPELEATIRQLTQQLLADDAPPAVKEVADAFHVAGTVAGESETQIFLKTRTGEPVSLSILRRPGQPPRWGVSLGEIVDETAVPPEPGTLLWYRLACSLPAKLPATATRSLESTDMVAAQRDYNLVLESLGRCGRTL